MRAPLAAEAGRGGGLHLSLRCVDILQRWEQGPSRTPLAVLYNPKKERAEISGLTPC
jgi:hypothetical protein